MSEFPRRERHPCACDGLCTARIGIFSTLSPEDQRLLVRKARHRHVGEGVTIFHENDPAEQILVVHSGRVKLNRYLPDGREYVLDTLTGGGIYGEQWLFSSKRHEVNAITLEPASYCEIHRDDILALVRQHPDVGIGMLFELGSKLSRVSRMHELLSIRDARARLAGYLLLLGREAGSGTLSLSRDEIAAATSLRHETISRRLREMEQEGLLQLNGHRGITLLNIKGLQDILDTAG